MQGMTWLERFEELAEEFAAWGGRYSRRKLPEIAAGYECTPLFFWNWMDDPEVHKTETGFLRVLGYAWRKHLQEEAEPAPRRAEAPEADREKPGYGGRIAA